MLLTKIEILKFFLNFYVLLKKNLVTGFSSTLQSLYLFHPLKKENNIIVCANPVYICFFHCYSLISNTTAYPTSKIMIIKSVPLNPFKLIKRSLNFYSKTLRKNFLSILFCFFPLSSRYLLFFLSMVPNSFFSFWFIDFGCV